MRRQSFISSLMIASLLAPVLPAGPVRAAMSSCLAEISPHSVAPNADTPFNLSLYNSDGAASIVWVRVTRPGASYVTIEDAAAYTWTASITANQAVLTGGNLTPGNGQGIAIQALSGPNNQPSANWTVEVSDSPDGAGAITCDGDNSLNIQRQPSIINVSNIAVSAIGPTTAQITWDTDTPSTSQVKYGTDYAYGSVSLLAGALVTHHSVKLTGLTPDTSYHFAVVSTTPADGGTVTSADNTLLTAAEQAPVLVDVPSGVVVVPSAQAAETVPPSIVLTTKLGPSYAAPPTFTGTASDNVAVAQVEYSIDGGRNWTAADKITPQAAGKGKPASLTKVDFSFTPVIIDEGNYNVMARATDPSGNQATTASVVLVIDRLPPQFGPSEVQVGTQMLLPQADGRVTVPVGAEVNFRTSIIGGANRAWIEGQIVGASPRIFSLSRSVSSGIWQGVLSFDHPGLYRLRGRAVDGVGHQGDRDIMEVLVVPGVGIAGQAQQSSSKPVKLTLMHYNAEDYTWSPWAAAEYGQSNPQTVSGQKTAHWLVPAGTYYVRASRSGQADTVTRQFTTTGTTPLTGNIPLGQPAHLTLGAFKLPLPWTETAPALLPGANATGAGKATAGWAEQHLPLVTLPQTDGTQLTTTSLLGKPTVIAALATWSEAASGQLTALASVAKSADVQVVTLARQQRAETLAAFLQVAGSSLVGTADPNGTLDAVLTEPAIPVLYFVDRHGIIKAVMVGQQSAGVIHDLLTRLE